MNLPNKIIVALLICLLSSVEQQVEGSDFIERADASRIFKDSAIPRKYTSTQEILVAAKQGNAGAQALLGMRYYEGEDIPQDDKEAVRWFRKAADQHHRGGQCMLGRCYLQGRGVSKDRAEAAKWLLLAAEQNLPFAQVAFGVLCTTGRGVKQDTKTGYEWITKAAEGGDESAQYLLGGAYTSGRERPQDLVQACKWYLLSAAQGNEKAEEKLADLVTQLTAEQKAEVSKLTKEFVPRPDKTPPVRRHQKKPQK